MKMDQLIAFYRIFGSCDLGPPQKNYFFAVRQGGSFGRILTMQLEPPKNLEMTIILTLRQQSVLRGLAFQKPHVSTHRMY